MNDSQQVLHAAAALVAAFARNDSEAYFAAFSADASFLFYSHPERLPTRAAYRALWDSWQRDGLRVLDCQSSQQSVSVHGELAVFLHDVHTRLRLGDADLESRERETIVFRRDAATGHWLACHEHLSAMPAAPTE